MDGVNVDLDAGGQRLAEVRTGCHFLDVLKYRALIGDISGPDIAAFFLAKAISTMTLSPRAHRCMVRIARLAGLGMTLHSTARL